MRIGNRTIGTNGYVLIFVGEDHHLAHKSGYAYEHRVVMEKKLGRCLQPSEIVHHIDHDKQNNKPDNLALAEDQAHHLVHHRNSDSNKRLPNEPNPLIVCACGCGEAFEKFDYYGRPRVYVHVNTPLEHKLREAIAAVEQAGAHPALTQASTLLQQALDKVSDWVDSEIAVPRNWQFNADVGEGQLGDNRLIAFSELGWGGKFTPEKLVVLGAKVLTARLKDSGEVLPLPQKDGKVCEFLPTTYGNFLGWRELAPNENVALVVVIENHNDCPEGKCYAYLFGKLRRQ